MLCLMLAFPVLTLTGCGGEPELDEYGRVRILMGLWPSDSEKNRIPGLEELFERRRTEFEQRFPNFVIVPRPFSYDPGAISAQARAGTLPTIFQTYFTEPSRLIQNGWVRPINEQLVIQGRNWADYMNPILRDGLTRDGNIYGVPRDGYALGLLVNLDLLWGYGEGTIQREGTDGPFILYDGAGNPLYPTTFNGVRRASEAVVDTHATARGMTVLSTHNQGGWQFSNMAWNFGLESFQYEQDGRWNSRLNAPASVNAMTWLHEMNQANLLVEGAHNYTDWPTHINQRRSAMAIVGSDMIVESVIVGGEDAVPLEHLGFFPMPSQEGVQARTLTGGVPFMFCSRATDRQVYGALRFLEHMGLAPIDTPIMRRNITEGLEVAQAAGHPILPTFIPPWTNPEFINMINEIESQFINVPLQNFQSFIDSLDEMMFLEEPHIAQTMYYQLDRVLQYVLTRDNPGIQTRLNEAQTTFNNTLNREVNNNRRR